MTILKFLRLAIVTLYTAVISVVSFLICLVRPFHAKNSYIAGRLLGRPVLAMLGIRTRIENWNGLYQHRPCIFVSNHQSNIDLFLCGQWISPGTVSLGKKSIRLIPFFGLMYWFAGNILIDRGNKKKAFGTMDQAAAKVRERQVSIWMMPEGTRHKSQGVKTFKKGPFYTAIKAGVPIVPVAYSEYNHDLDFSQVLSGVVFAKVLEPIQTTHLTLDDVDELTKTCHRLVAQAVEELSKEASLALQEGRDHSLAKSTP